MNSAQNHFASWTILQLRSHLSTQGVEWHQWMKKATLVKLCEENRIKNKSAGGMGDRGGRRGRRGRRSAAQSVTGENMEIDDTNVSNEGADNDEGDDTMAAADSNPPFPPAQIKYLDQLAERLMVAAVKAVKEATPSCTAPRPSETVCLGAAVTGASGAGHRPDTQPLHHTTGVPTPPPVVASTMHESLVNSQKNSAQGLAAVTVSGGGTSQIPSPDNLEPRFGSTTWKSPTGFPGGSCLLPGTTNGEDSPKFGSKGVSINDLPPQDFVSVSLRKDILAGKDVNLASLLIEDNKQAGPREIQLGEETLTFKPVTDKRLTGALQLDEFSIAFTKYQDIICEVYPDRRGELAAYHSSIIKMAHKYRGVGFYDYHKQFSFKAAQYLLQKGIKVDWSIRDSDLYMSIFTGQQASSCDICGNFTHGTNFCPDKSNDAYVPPYSKWGTNKGQYPPQAGNGARKDKKGRSIIPLSNGQQVCNNYNKVDGCPFKDKCKFTHICSSCKKAHPKFKCAPVTSNKATPFARSIPSVTGK